MMKLFKKSLFAILAIFTAVFVFAGCSQQKIEPQDVKIAALSGPTGMGMAQMIVDKPSLGEEVTSEYTVATSPDQLLADVISGSYQIAAIPTNAAATLYNKTQGKVILGAVNTLGTLSIVSTQGENITKLEDLRGKTVVATGQGSVPEYVLTSLLEKAGLTPGTDVTITWLAEHSEAAAKLASGEAQIAMLPQPFATTALAQNADLVQAIDLSKAWEDYNDGQKLEMGCIVVNKEWADANPAVVKNFMELYEKSINTINEDTDGSAQYVVDAGIIPKKELAKKAIPNCSMTFIKAADAKEDLNAFYETLNTINPKSIGGTVPAADSDFYGIKY